MQESVGTRLKKERIRRQLSVDEAARITRMRPDKIQDLEDDNYSTFPSMSYAKGFLLIYAKFLNVNVRDFTDTLRTPNPVSTDDYEYLNAAASVPPPPPSRRPYHFAPRRQHSILPLVVFAFLLFAVGIGTYLVITAQRLGNPEELVDKKESGALAATSTTPAISTLPGNPAPAPAPAASAVPTPAPFDPTREVRPAIPVAAASTPAPPPVAAGPSSTPPALKDISIKPLKKTRVTIRQDVAGSAPVFEDWLYPDAGPLVLHGLRFWIKLQDPSAVQVTENGKPLPAGQTDIQIE